MASEPVKVFCRVKPVDDNSLVVNYNVKDGFNQNGTMEFQVPQDFVARHTQNMSSTYKFKFDQVFDQLVGQLDIYQAVAKPIVENALNGFNGTVFVYGQTATGKTYTIMGEEKDDNNDLLATRKKNAGKEYLSNRQRLGNKKQRSRTTQSTKAQSGSPANKAKTTKSKSPRTGDPEQKDLVKNKVEMQPVAKEDEGNNAFQIGNSETQDVVVETRDVTPEIQTTKENSAENADSTVITEVNSPPLPQNAASTEKKTRGKKKKKKLKGTGNNFESPAHEVADFTKGIIKIKVEEDLAPNQNSLEGDLNQQGDRGTEISQLSATPSGKDNDKLPSSSGIVYRTLSHLFTELEQVEYETELKISYHEIYKETGYDLLTGKKGKRTVSDLKELPKVVAMMDAKRRLHLRNLSFHKIKDEAEALDLLRLGNANRQVAETHLNDASSRSHCIFTIYLTMKIPEEEKILRSKIHLVDLAGSERIGKSHENDRRLLSEGRNINLSLHHLQQVIVALTKKKSTLASNKHYHVPYRNSAMTLVLSDSLGGNSYTSMIATISAELENLEESISTCRFAQQVASIDNAVSVNETEDVDLIIARLKAELAGTKVQLHQATGSSLDQNLLTIDDFRLLEEMVQEYLETEEQSAVLEVGADRRKINYCFEHLKAKYLEQLEENMRLKTGAIMPHNGPPKLPQQPVAEDVAQPTQQVENNKSKACIIS
ncbi:uncharacterized protein LOC143459543 [Clavelina lepadiformis]|uniref:Kinesin-like protein n=1 Tax=Clavelina lepadiformis TaxID=159417 RepID=A0ABP0GF58_CLALP